jgi:DNA-directed RNA polymerase specialized sigma24 family protein
MPDVTELLRRVAADDRGAIDELFELLYSDLHRMARARLAENSPITQLNTTALAHEAYLRLRNAERIDLDSRPRFMAYVSQVLRSIIVDFRRTPRSSTSTTRSTPSSSRIRALRRSSRCATSAA